MHKNDFLTNFMSRYDYPEQAQSTFLRVAERLDNESDFGAAFDAVVNGYMYPQPGDLKEALGKISELAEKYGENVYTMHFEFLLFCMPILRERFLEKGYPEQLFYDEADDLRCKLLECIECKGVPGTFVADWNRGFLEVDRFALGRFQFEERTYHGDSEFVTACGKVVKPGDTVINFHIPSSGIPLTDEVRFASYKKAHEFYKDLFPDGKTVFACGSWLLYPRHREFLPEKSNILRFLDDFEIVAWAEKDDFHDAWRVFGKYAGKPVEELPRDTSLRRAYSDWLLAGNKTGDGYGFIVFDGEKILK